MIGPNFAERRIGRLQLSNLHGWSSMSRMFLQQKWVIGMKQIQQLEPLGHWIDGLQGAKSEKCAGCRLACQMGARDLEGLEVWRFGFRPYHSMLASCCIFGCTRSNTRISNHGENIVELFKSLDIRQRKRQTHKLQNFLNSACWDLFAEPGRVYWCGYQPSTFEEFHSVVGWVCDLGYLAETVDIDVYHEIMLSDSIKHGVTNEGEIEILSN